MNSEDDDDTIIGLPAAPVDLMLDGETILRSQRHGASARGAQANDDSANDDSANDSSLDEDTANEDTITTGSAAPALRKRIAPVATVQPARPPVAQYRFRINLAAPIALDGPCLIGRKPIDSRISRSTPLRLVRVPSPLNEVSSTHLELRQVGSSVLVTDLSSTNGTTILVPGLASFTLQSDCVVVSPGTVLGLGEGIVIEIMAGERLVHSTLPAAVTAAFEPLATKGEPS